MKFVLFVLIIGSIKLANAGWGAFRVITPENMSEYDIELVRLSKNDGYIEFCLADSYVRPSGEIRYKSAWLLESRVSLPPKKLNFEGHFNKLAFNENISSTTVLTSYNDEPDKCQMQFKVKLENINNSFVFVGYEIPVNDGGLRYTIQLSSFQ
jgi:hypothetical protein